MRGRLALALRAGYTTLLMGMLVSAALLALPLALETNFAHHHPDGTPTHAHPFELFVGNSLPALPTTAAPIQLRTNAAPLVPPQPFDSLEASGNYQSRAPPTPIG